MTSGRIFELVVKKYLEPDYIRSYEDPDALEEISESVDEGCSDGQAAVGPLLTRPGQV